MPRLACAPTHLPRGLALHACHRWALRSSRLEITALGKFTLEHATRLIADYIQDQDLMSMYKYEVIFATNEFDLATPSMELDEDGGPLQAGSSMLGSVGV